MKNLCFFALLLLSSCIYAQTGNIIVNNNTNCDMTVTMYADDNGTAGTNCDFVSNWFTLGPFSTYGPTDICTFQSTIGWTSSPGAVPLCPGPPYSLSFFWTGASIRLSNCTGVFPFYNAPGFPGLIDLPGLICTTNPASYVFPCCGSPTIDIILTSGTLPYDIQVNAN